MLIFNLCISAFSFRDQKASKSSEAQKNVKIVDLVFEAAIKVDRLNDDFVVEASISLSRIYKCQLAMAVVLSLAICAELLVLPLLFADLSQPQNVLTKSFIFPIGQNGPDMNQWFCF